MRLLLLQLMRMTRVNACLSSFLKNTMVISEVSIVELFVTSPMR